MPKDNEVSVVNVRLVKEPSLYSPEPIHSPQDVLNVIAKELSQYDREVFAILNLKSNGQVINLNIASVGTLDTAMVSPREIFKASILSNAGAFIAVHNHPSGNVEPSQEDFATTKRLQECIPVGFAEGKERIQRDGIHTGLGNVVLRPRLIGIHPLLNGERFDFHRLPPFLI